MGHAEERGLRRWETSGSRRQLTQSGQDVADANATRWHGRAGDCGPGWREESTNGCRWLPEPNVGRVAHGIPRRVDRLKGLGNAIVPQVAFEILKGIAEIESSND